MATIPQRLQNILPDKMHVYALDFFDHTDRTLLNEHVTQNKQERAHVDSFYPSAIEHRSHITLHYISQGARPSTHLLLRTQADSRNIASRGPSTISTA
jgi:hypothetical protein